MSEAEQAPRPDPSKDEAPKATQQSTGGGKALASVAAILALSAIGAAGYVWTEVQKLQALPQQMQAGAGQTDRLRGEFEQRLQSLNVRLDDSAVATGELQRVLTAEIAAIADMSLQLEALGEQVDTLTGTDREQRNRFLRAEALYYLRIANAQASLAGDAQVAVEALQLADAKLRETGDPQLDAVRARLAEDLTALRAVPQLDITGVAFRLQSLAGQVVDWPLRNPAPESFNTAKPEVAASDESGATDAWARFKATVTGVFRTIVKVRENADRPEVQLSGTQHALVIESVRAELQLARLAYVTGEFALFEQALNNADAQIRGYFATDSGAVTAALEALAELTVLERPAAMPDVSGAASLLLGLSDASESQ